MNERLTTGECKCFDGALYPEQVVSVSKNPNFHGDYVLYIINKDRKELLVIGEKINFCPMCGRKLKDDEEKPDHWQG